MPTLTKRDTHTIWSSHLPAVMAARIDRLRQNEKIELIINGTRTTWYRMRNGSDGRETKGIRVGPGRSKEIWERIPLEPLSKRLWRTIADLWDLRDRSGKAAPK